MLKPLNDRVLIKPHKNPDETESGLILPENRTEQYLEMQGTVIAVGTPKHPKKEAAEELAGRLMTCDGDECLDPECQAARMLRVLTSREPCVKPGDDVLFSYTAGQEITIDDETFLLMREDDLLAVLETA